MMTLSKMSEKLDGELMSAAQMLSIGEQTLEHWIIAREQVPTEKDKEGFRLLALHRQGAKGEPSFNACRETCRELVYYYNLITLDPEHVETLQRLNMMKLITSHLYYFITGKMEQSQLGEFCCSSRPIRTKLDGQIN